MLLDNILDGALMYEIIDKNPMPPQKEGEVAESQYKSSRNLSNVDDDEDASGLQIKYTNSTLRYLFKSIIQEQSIIDKIGFSFDGKDEGTEEQELEFSIETMKSVYIRNTCFKIQNNKLIE